MRTLAIVLMILLLCPVLKAQEEVPDLAFHYVGHRGASYLAPENTLASIKLAWELGAEGAECDVMLTSDQRVVLFHDKNTKKLTGANFMLEDVLAIIPGDRMLVIEIKTGPEILPHLQKVITEHWKSGKISFIAFDFETIKQAKVLYPEVPCYYLSSFKSDLSKHFDAILESKLDGVDLRHPMIDGDLMEKCHASGLDVWCWTVNDPETAKKMKELGVSAITTDRPAWLKNSLKSKKIN